jgi:hypothetical protein
MELVSNLSYIKMNIAISSNRENILVEICSFKILNKAQNTRVP